MFDRTKLACLFGMMVCLCPLAWAQWHANVGLVSDYVWRGASQTQEDPALQAGVDYRSASGWSLGIWGSNVEFDDTTDIEVDGYLAYETETDFGPVVEMGYIRYHYQEFDDADEVFLGVSTDSLSLKVSHGFKIDWNYVEANLELPLPREFAFLAHAGLFTFDVGEDVADWKFAVARSIWGIDVELGFTDTNMETAFTDSRWILSLTKSW